MKYLLLSIFFSTLILVIFRLFKRYNVNTFQAIVFNYIIAFTVGFGIYGNEWRTEHIEQSSWIPFAFIIGMLFISLFLLMGKSSQENGIGVTSVTVKMSLAIPVTMAIFLYNEAIFISKVAGVLAALIGVFLITFKPKSARQTKNVKNIIYLPILFLGSGLLDTLINYVEKRALGDLSPALFSAIGFGIAGLIGLMIFSIALLRGKQNFRWRNVLGGIVLGVPNFFSIYFLIMAVRNPLLDDSITYALNNVGIVMLSFLVGIIAFNEKTTALKVVGGLISIVAIWLLSW